MAGIGFELRKLVETRTLRGVLGAAFSGVIVVAGPWLVSAASLAAALRLPIFAEPGAGAVFSSAMVWALALSICLTAAPLHVYVRLSADLVYEGKRGQAAALLLKFSLAVFAAALPAGLALGAALAAGAPGAAGLVAGFALLLGSASALWAVTMTATVIRKYGRVLASYVLGMALMYILARALGPSGGAAGALIALAAGYALAAAALAAATVESLGLAPFPGAFRRLLEYARKYRNLALAGAAYALGTWADKAVMALLSGVSYGGTRFAVNEGYDAAFYFANLALIPGLVYFTIAGETEFHLGLKRFVFSLARRRLPEIESTRSRLARISVDGLIGQTALQASVALCLSVAAPLFAPGLGIPALVFSRLLAGGVFQLALLAGLNMLFYLELYRDAALGALAFALLDGLFTAAAAASPYARELLGLPYLASCALSAFLVYALAQRGIARFDRILFLRASGSNVGL
jgi:polysaccharide biosynthesis protein PelG